MNKTRIPFWLIFLAILLVIKFPPLLIFFIFAFIAFQIFKDIARDSKSKFPDLSDLLNDELKDLFSQKKKKGKVITVNEKNSSQKFSFSSPNMPPVSIGKTIGGVFALLFVVALVIDGFVNVPASHVAVIFDKSRGVLDDPLPEGLHLKIPFWQEATLFKTTKQKFSMIGDSKGFADADAVRGRSKDAQDVIMDVTVTYQINGIDAPDLRRQFLNEAGYNTTIVQPAARSFVYEAIGQFNALDIVSEKRKEFNDYVQSNLEKKYKENNIQLRDILVRNITFSPEFAKEIEQKQIAEQRIQTAENQKQEAVKIGERVIIEAKAEAESITLKGNALRENPEVIQLQFVEKMAPQINWGILPDGALPLIDLKTMQQQ